jgi:hypothetical protein
MDNLQSESKSPSSLIVMLEDKIVFESNRNWLYPLFDLEDYLNNHFLDLSSAKIIDKVIGKAAAMLIANLAPHSVHAGVMSQMASNYFIEIGISFTYNQLVPRIACKTEELLLNVNDFDEAYQILCARAGRC